MRICPMRSIPKNEVAMSSASGKEEFYYCNTFLGFAGINKGKNRLSIVFLAEERIRLNEALPTISQCMGKMTLLAYESSLG